MKTVGIALNQQTPKDKKGNKMGLPLTIAGGTFFFRFFFVGFRIAVGSSCDPYLGLPIAKMHHEGKLKTGKL